MKALLGAAFQETQRLTLLCDEEGCAFYQCRDTLPGQVAQTREGAAFSSSAAPGGLREARLRCYSPYMRSHACLRPFVASLLGAALLSCSTTSPGADGIDVVDLGRSVLMIQELPDGRVIHTWHRAEEFNLSRYKQLSQAGRVPRRIVLTARWQRDCDKENDECVDKCLGRPLPEEYNHITSRGAKAAYCRQQCQQAYDDCRELERLQPQKFTAVDDALDWLKRHRKEILVGSVIIIAGVAFVVVSAGTGLVILAPALLLTGPDSESSLYLAEGVP